MSETSYSPRKQPFLFLTAALLTGILVHRFARPPLWVPAAGATLTLSCAIALIRASRAGRATVLLLLCVASAGVLLTRARESGIGPSRLKSLFEAETINANDPVELTGTLAAPPEPAEDAYILDVEAATAKVGDTIKQVTGSARLGLPTADQRARDEFNSLHLDYGSQIRVLVRLDRAKSYLNPGSPDFNEFLERKGYDLKGNIKSVLLIEPLGRAPVNRFLAWLFHTRFKMIHALDRAFEPSVAGTLKAMMVGSRYSLDPQIEEHLREGATFHVLVISGLHVGLVALLLLGITGGWSARARRSHGLVRLLRAPLALSALWSYVLMVGLAAPVTRAATMMTIGLVGPLVIRQAASMNSLALAAFIMLALNPALAADPGFQLSFAAVAAIVGLALPINRELRKIGKWRPSAETPHPPRCAPMVRSLAEAMFWDNKEFAKQMAQSPIQYRLDKARAANVLSRFRIQAPVRQMLLLLITSAAIQLTTLPLMAYYFNRVAPVGVLLNVFAGLLTMTLMAGSALAVGLAAAGPIVPGVGIPVSALVWLVRQAHTLLANMIVPFADLPGATFRVAHYEGRAALIYALYFIPLGAIVVALDRWRPVDSRGPAQLQGLDAETPATGSQSANSSIPMRRRLMARPVLWGTVTIAAVTLVVFPPPIASDGRLTVHFLDVGQGDSALIVFPHGATMLVDGGGELNFGQRGSAKDSSSSDPSCKGEGRGEFGDSGGWSEGQSQDNDPVTDPPFRDSAFHVGEAVVSRFLWSQHRREVDYVLATHADADHIGGLSYVARNFSVGEALVGHVPTSNCEFKHFVREAGRKRIPLGVLEAAEQFEIQGVTVQVLWPPRPDHGPVTSGNDDSVVLRLVYGSVAMLLAGDIEKSSEEALCKSGLDLRADVLKVPHHGSRTSSADAFLDAVRPRCAVISVGERSRFGHPDPDVVNRYLTRGVRLFQTGNDGTVTVKTDGSTLETTTFRTR